MPSFLRNKPAWRRIGLVLSLVWAVSVFIVCGVKTDFWLYYGSRPDPALTVTIIATGLAVIWGVSLGLPWIMDAVEGGNRPPRQ